MTVQNNTKKVHKEPFIYITKRSDITKSRAILIKACVIVVGIFLCALITVLLTGKSPIQMISSMYKGSFGSKTKIWNLLQGSAMLLGISLAVTPGFKMRFWNTGAEGQVLIGMLASVACMYYIGDSLPSVALIIIMFFASVIAGAIWAGIPGFFKAIWNTNETLFTLMMNYVAMQLVSFFIMLWVPSGSQVLGVVNLKTQSGWFPTVFGQKYLLNIIIVAVITVIVYVYLKKSKQGYEISVVGESENTARYIGINVKQVVIRTVLISGALCGIMGWVMAAGSAHSVAQDSVGGNGFTAIMVSWMSKFDPLVMAVYSVFLCFLQRGASQFGTDVKLLGVGVNVGEVLTGIMILAVVSSEFFSSYKIHLRNSKKGGNE